MSLKRTRVIVSLIIMLGTCFMAEAKGVRAIASVEAVFKMDQYNDAASFKEGVKGYLKGSGTSKDVLAYLDTHWDAYSYPDTVYSNTDTTLRFWIEYVFCEKKAYGTKLDAGNDNANLWRIMFVRCFGFTKRFQTQLIFDDRNFAARGLPFSFEYFDDATWDSDKRLSNALMSIEVKNPGLKNIEKVLLDSGARKKGYYYNKEGKIESAGYEYNVDYRKINPLASPWKVSIWMDSEEKIKKITSTIPNVTLP